MNPASEDPSVLLGDEGQWTEPWGSSEDGASCDKCNGTGRTRHQCWSCVLTRARQDCPACSGAVRWEDGSPVCRGCGRVDGEPRHGVSVFPTLELYRYMLATGADVDGCLVVELSADPADDVDFDADQGAMLVISRRITGCAAIDRERLAEVKDVIGEGPL